MSTRRVGGWGFVVTLCLTTAAAWGGAGAAGIEPVTALPAQIPIDGFTPFVVLGITDEADAGGGDLLSDGDPQAWYRPSLAGNLLPSGDAAWSVVLYDTGANANLLSFEDWSERRSMNSTGELFVVEGAGPNSVVAEIIDGYGFFVDGLDAIDGTTVNTGGMRGVGNVRAIGAENSSTVSALPSVVGTPLSIFYTTVIHTDQMHTVQWNGQEYTSPRVDLHTSRYAEDVPRTFDHRINVTYLEGGTTVPPVYVDGAGSLGLLPSTPTVSEALMVDDVVVEHSLSQNRTTGGRFLFDTGAQVTVISLDLAYDLGLNVDLPEFTVEITGVGGSIQDAPGFTVDKLRLPATGLGDMVLQDVPVIILNVPNDDSPIDGIVGMNLFTDRNLVVHGGYGETSGTFGNPFVGVGAVNPQGQGTYCRTSSGDWSDATTWDNGVPDAALNAYVEWGREVAVSAPVARAHSLTLGRVNSGSGTLRLSGTDRRLEIGSKLHLGPSAIYAADAGAIIEMASGAELTIAGTRADVLAGTEATTLIFAGGDQTSSLEVASKADLETNGNFSFQSVQIGPASAGRLRLVDEHDNWLDGPGDEVLAVDVLTIGAGSVLDLGQSGVWIGDSTWSESFAQSAIADGLIVSDRSVAYTPSGSGLLIIDALGGDINLDGIVDSQDMDILRQSFSTSATWAGGDLNHDGQVSFADYVIMARNWGSGTAPTPGEITPEPGFLALTLAGGAWLARRRRRRG
jgi:hypothetical protein